MSRIQNLRHGKVKSHLYRHSLFLVEQSDDERSLPTQMGVYPSAPWSQFGASPSPHIQQTGAPPFAASGYLLYGAAAANLSGMDLKPFQSQPHPQPAGEIVAPAPLIHKGTTNTPKPSTPKPTTVAANTQSPDTPSKRILMKSIESYFASAKKPAFTLPIEDKYPISYPAYPKPSPPNATRRQRTWCSCTSPQVF
jgi:hypothetical protein